MEEKSTEEAKAVLIENFEAVHRRLSALGEATDHLDDLLADCFGIMTRRIEHLIDLLESRRPPEGV